MKKIEKIKETILDVAGNTIKMFKEEYPNFPLDVDGHGFCAEASKELATHLKYDARLKNSGVEFFVQRGNVLVSPYFNPEREGMDILKGHYYIVATIKGREHILDITATQFNDDETGFDEIVFKPKSELCGIYFDFINIPRWVEKRIRAIERERKTC